MSWCLLYVLSLSLLLPPQDGDVPNVDEASHGHPERMRELQTAFRAGNASPRELRDYVDLVLRHSRTFAEDEERLYEALEAAEYLGDGDLQARVCIRRGYLLNSEGKLQEALEEFRDATLRAGSPAVRMQARSVSVDPLLQVFDFDGAQAAVAEMERIFADWPAPTREAEMQLQHTRFRLYLACGMADRCHAPLARLEALVAARSDGDDPAWIPLLALDRLDWFNRMLRHEEALEVGAGLDRALLHSYPGCEAQIDLRLGISAWLAGNDARAIDSFLAVAANPAAASAEQMQAESRLAEIHARQGRLAEAKELLLRARARPAASTATAFSSLEDDLYLLALESRLELADGAAIERGFQRFVSGWESVPERSGGIGLLGSTRQRMFLVEWMRDRMKASPGEPGRLEALEGLCRIQALGSLPRALLRETGTSAPSFAEVRARCTSDDSGILVYLPERSSGLVFAVDEREVRCAEIPGELALVAGSRELGAWLAREGAKNGAELERLARELAPCLLPEPILPALLKWSSVTVVGSELLGPVPLELLPFAGGRLEQRVAVSYLPSLPVGELLHRRAERRERGPGRDLVLIAAPALPPGAGPKRAPLPFDDGHLERLLRDLEPERARVFARHGATAAALSSGEVRAARSLAVIAHGERDDARERPTVFQLASDSGVASIGCNEVEELLVPPVVVLCVCHAARGPVRAGDGGAGDLGGAFLRAGAQAVLLAPWSIDYEDACELAGLVLEHLRRGDPPTRALNRARSSFLAGARGEDPSRAFLRVVGLGGRPVF